jgi:hypothetical protein
MVFKYVFVLGSVYQKTTYEVNKLGWYDGYDTLRRLNSLFALLQLVHFDTSLFSL